MSCHLLKSLKKRDQKLINTTCHLLHSQLLVHNRRDCSINTNKCYTTAGHELTHVLASASVGLDFEAKHTLQGGHDWSAAGICCGNFNAKSIWQAASIVRAYVVTWRALIAQAAVYMGMAKFAGGKYEIV
eukprot:scaffold95516_cov23-Prasinocladus_malaysianus.AAC.1